MTELQKIEVTVVPVVDPETLAEIRREIRDAVAAGVLLGVSDAGKRLIESQMGNAGSRP